MSSFLASIDPGSRKSGLAIFRDGRLVDCRVLVATGDDSIKRVQEMASLAREVVNLQHDTERGRRPVFDVVIEWPPHMPGRPGQQLIYAVVGGLMVAFAEYPIELVTPSTWKKAIVGDPVAKKPAIRDAVRLHTLGDWDRNPAYKKVHADGFDALGLGLYFLQKQKMGGMV